MLIHHASKGSQSTKAITDVGAGAGSQSRATDTHLIVRPHEQAGAVVLDAAVRSWPPIAPMCLRWTFPVWQRADDLDPADLRPERPRRPRKPTTEAEPAVPRAPAWTAERFGSEIVSAAPASKAAIVARAVDAGLSQYAAAKWLTLAEGKGIVHRWRFGPRDPHQFGTIAQPTLRPIENAQVEDCNTKK